jgi:hypothetical protein
MIGKVKIFRAGGYDPNIPKELGTIADAVLRYRPPEKEKATKKRDKRRRQRVAKKR